MKLPSFSVIALSVLLASIFSSSCKSNNKIKKPDKNKEIVPQQTLKLSPNIVKVLNNVICNNCNQNQINALWQECINQGYTQAAPDQRVVFSREISELVSTTYTYFFSKPKTLSYTDQSGIVTEIQKTTKVPISIKLSGQCRGSEYILK